MATVPIERADQHVMGVIRALTEPAEEDLLAAGLYLRGQIRDRTYAGQSADGGEFAPYSPKYAKRKGQTNVDLRSRGAGAHMLDALMVRTERSAVTLGIFGSGDMAARAQAHNEGASIRTRQGRKRSRGNATFTMPRRQWLAATAPDIDAMGRLMADRMVAKAERTTR